MANDNAEKNWIDVARRGVELLGSGSEHGQVLAQKAEVAASLGVSRQTLRNYVDCYRFLKAVEADRPDAGSALRGFSATAVAIFSRWYKYDPEGAMDYAIAAQELPVPMIVAAEKAARNAVRPASPTLLESAFRGATGSPGREVIRAFDRLGKPAPRLEDLRLVENADELSSAMGANQILSAGGDVSVAVIELDRGAVGDGHRRNARSTLAKATLAAAAHPLVFILLPDSEALSEFVAALPTLESYAFAAGRPWFLFADGLGVVAAAAADRFSQEWSTD